MINAKKEVTKDGVKYYTDTQKSAYTIAYKLRKKHSNAQISVLCLMDNNWVVSMKREKNNVSGK